MDKNETPYMIIIPFLLMGIIGIIIGSYLIYKDNIKSENYHIIDGKFIGSSVYSKDSDGTTYKLTYSYNVNDNEYKLSTNYGSGFIPDIGSIKSIKYNPDNPNEAMFTGLSSSIFILLAGIFTFLLTTAVIFKNSKYSSIVILLSGCIFYYIIGSEINDFSLFNIIKNSGLWILIPVLFIIIGIYSLICSIFNFKIKKNKDKNIKEV